MSIQDHKDFTAWELATTCKRTVGAETGVRIAKENATLKKVVGCTLMWWEDGKIVWNHDCVQIKEV